MALEQEVAKLHENQVRLRVIGDLASFEPRLTRLIAEAEALTAANAGLTLTIAANYGGRWDMLQAVNRMVREVPERAGGYREADLAPFLAMSYAPEPDLFIRTGGEQRVSNFLLWQLAYTEMYFTPELWPDFDGKSLARAIDSYRRRERRFGRTSEQLAESSAPREEAAPSGSR
jgi:undecaprenyl diphosphate synthase